MSTKKQTADVRQKVWLKEFNDEFRYEIILNESDRGAVLVASAFVEEALEHLLRQVLTTKSCNSRCNGFPAALNDLLRSGMNSPLGSFSARIDVCYVMGMIDLSYYTALNALKGLRNSFAHRKENGGRPELTLSSIESIYKSSVDPGVWDLRYIGLLPDEVDFDSTVETVGTPRVMFALAVWMLLRGIIDETEWWREEAKQDTSIRSIARYSGQTFRTKDDESQKTNAAEQNHPPKPDLHGFPDG